MLAAQGVLDAFGHVSSRNPARPDRFLIPRNLAPALVTERDVVELDLDGNLADPSQGAQLFLERFIHGEIYRRRPDVQAVRSEEHTSELQSLMPNPYAVF